MGSTSDKVKGTANQAIGKVKQGVGEATEIPAEGRGQASGGQGRPAEGRRQGQGAVKKAADL